jgi:predicted HTH transcriptional regulator
MLIYLEVLLLVSTSRERLTYIIGLFVLLGTTLLAGFIAWTRYESLRQSSIIHGSYRSDIGSIDTFANLEEKYILNHPLKIEETRHYEFKEITGFNAIKRIADASDEYASAFLNSEGGSIYWGIHNIDRVVVGVNLTDKQRDEVRRVITDKLTNMQPSILPQAYKIDLHPVYANNNENNTIHDLYVVKLAVAAGSSERLYYTGDKQAFIKTDSGKKQLKGFELEEEFIRRNNLKQRSYRRS